MGEVVDVSTAMERLCRELMDAVVSCAPTVWCGEHGIGIHGTRLEQDREHARADIERRIAEADLEDDRARDVALGDWKEKVAELDALKKAGRVMPEGVSWPRYENGEPVRIGDEVVMVDKGMPVEAIEFKDEKVKVKSGYMGLMRSYGDPYERPAPKAVGADGLEVKPGDTVWLAKGYREKAGSHGTRRDGYLVVAEYNLIGASALEGMTVYETLDDSCVSLTARGSWCPASWLTHTAPCTDKDGAPIDEGDEVWTEDGCRWKVLGIKSGGHPLQAKCVEGCHRGKRRDLKWTWVSHERPDSWERLREDVRKDYTAYWGCIGFCCDKCPALVDGKKPNERYDTAGCHTAEQLDLLVRAERLAGVRDDG